MATKTTASTKSTAKPAVKAKPAAAQAQAVEETAQAVATEERPMKRSVKEIDVHETVPVRNGFQGALVYVSKRTGETYVWSHFGDEQEIELQELKNAKSASRGFFERNWFMFDDEYSWVTDWLGVSGFYKNALKLDEFDEVFTMDPEEIVKRVSGLSDGQKASLTYRARKLLADGEIDSRRVVAALEDALGVQLLER